MNTYLWAVLGAGPAGIAAVGKLLDAGVPAAKILWLDPHFEVGDFGRLWSNVSSNTKVGLFKKFLKAVRSFQYDKAAPDFSLNHLNEEDTCLLSEMVAPLAWVTKMLTEQVDTHQTLAHTLRLKNGLWHIDTDDKSFFAMKVILATGSIPSVLNYPDPQVLPFDLAIDPKKLAPIIHSSKTYAVFGASHSALIIVRNLVELGVKKVINFYRSPCRYAVAMEDWILFDNTGLKGQTAKWAKAHIDGVWPSNLERYYSNEENVSHYLAECDEVIYAVGFEPRKLPFIEGYEGLKHNPYVGILAPGLFGLGIAYPQSKKDRLGNEEQQVGLWKFMCYLNDVLPIWMK